MMRLTFTTSCKEFFMSSIHTPQTATESEAQTVPAQAATTIANLEAAFAGESMAHIKYRYFAKIARDAGDEVTARHFEATAEQELMHAFGHLDLLYPKAKMTPARALEIAIEGETYEYTEMYPRFRHLALEEGNRAAVAEFDEQIAESREHADAFRALLATAAKRFAALARVEEKHAHAYQQALARVQAMAA
jgi:hypothetical protein